MIHTILMGDVIKSSGKAGVELARNLEEITGTINTAAKSNLLSPLTVTLGDEFQAVCTNLDGAIAIIHDINKSILERGIPFEMRYVILEGEIETPINARLAHGMIGPGLSQARNVLTEKTGERPRTRFILQDPRKEDLLNLIFRILDGMWEERGLKKNPSVFSKLLYDGKTNKEIAEDTKKTNSEIWKYRKNWRIDAYQAALEIVERGLYQ